MYEGDIIEWWDYVSDDETEMLSLGFRKKTGEWENLHGKRVDDLVMEWYRSYGSSS